MEEDEALMMLYIISTILSILLALSEMLAWSKCTRSNSVSELLFELSDTVSSRNSSVVNSDVDSSKHSQDNLD
jgi:hypothetical protein